MHKLSEQVGEFYRRFTIMLNQRFSGIYPCPIAVWGGQAGVSGCACTIRAAVGTLLGSAGRRARGVARATVLATMGVAEVLGHRANVALVAAAAAGVGGHKADEQDEERTEDLRQRRATKESGASPTPETGRDNVNGSPAKGQSWCFWWPTRANCGTVDRTSYLHRRA